MPVVKLTKASVDRMSAPEKGRILYFDAELKGFGLMVGRRTKTYFIQRDLLGGRTRRMKIGRHGIWTCEEARRKARELLQRIDSGEDPIESKRNTLGRSITLEEAAAAQRERLVRRGASPLTLRDQDAAINKNRYLGDWKKRPLAEISRAELKTRHERIGARAPYVANRVFRVFRAIYNTALKEHPDLPPNPTAAVEWFPEVRRQEPVPFEDLAAWHEKVQAIENPIRRDYHLFVLFTGLRRRDAASVRWEDIDFEAGTLHRPKPKGGRKRAFTIPLSGYLLDLLKGRKEGNGPFFEKDCPWVFPTYLRNGTVSHIREPKEKGLPSPHRLRDTYSSAANNAGLSPYDIDVLTNHRPANGSVTAGYINQGLEHLREQQEKVTEYLFGKLGI